MRPTHVHTLLGAVVVALALANATAQPAGPPSTPPRAPGAFQQPLTVRVGLLSEGNFPFAQKSPNAAAASKHGGLEGFEVSLMDALCARANLSCMAVPIDNLEDRIQGVANGTLNLAISSLSYTPGRAAVVQFVRPFYYSSGAPVMLLRPGLKGVALFADSSRAGLALFGPGSKPDSAPAGWHGVFSGDFPIGQTLCFVEGYYALPFVVEDHDIKIKVVPTLEDAAASVRSGDCAALAYDSASASVGLPMLAAPPIYVTPYGVAVSQAEAGGELEQRLVWALTGVMNAGNASEILALERQWLVPNGVGPSSALQTVVDAVSDFVAPLQAGPGKIPESYQLFGVRPGGRRLLGW